MSLKVRVENGTHPDESIIAPLPGRIYRKGERPSPGIRKKGAVKVCVGNVSSVDTDRMLMKVILTGDRDGDILENIPITQSYAGNASYVAAAPELNSTVVLIEGPDYTYPVTYIPKYRLGIRQEHAELWDKDKITTNDRNEFFFRFRKLNKGEVSFSSSSGCEIFLGRNVCIGTNNGENIKVRHSDNSIIQTSINNYVFAGGVWSNSGIIQRNSMEELDRTEGSYAEADELPSGRINYNLRPMDNAAASDYYTEYRIEVEDKAKDDMPGNDVNRIGGEVFRNPAAIFSMGHYVGNNVRSEDTYGRILKPSLFNDYNDTNGDFFFDVLTGQEPSTLGMAFTLYAPDRRNPESGALFGADKEGHFYHFLPSGTGGGICPGRSMSILAKGSKKEIWGADSKYSNAWDMTLEGGLKWVVDAHGESPDNPYSNLSMDVTTSRGVYFKYGVDQGLGDLASFEDDATAIQGINKYKKIEIIGGFERKQVEMSRETIIEGSDFRDITGKQELAIGGSSNTSVGETYNLSVGNSFNEKVSKEKQEGYGSRETTITDGSSVLNMIPTSPTTRGDIEENILGRGSKSTNIVKGDIAESILTSGSRSFFTVAGDFSVGTLKGDLSLETVAGKVILKTVAGKLEAKATLGMKLEASAGTADLKGMLVKIKGTGGAMGGVITNKSHKDYVTGAPLIGSLSVKASL
jgi:hypothetical protein